MTGKQLTALFTINLALNTMAVVVGALLPVFASRLGADSVVNGVYLATTAATIAVGNIAAGWFSDRLQRRKTLLIVAGVMEIGVLWLMGQATTLTQLFVFTIATALLFGAQATTCNIMAGLFAEESERGRTFGLMASGGSLGALIGGSIGGPIVDKWGFPGLFTALALVTIVQPLAGLLLHDKAFKPVQRTAKAHKVRSPLLSTTFLLLFFASIVVFATGGIQGMGRSLLMDKLGFGAAAITSTVAVSGLISLPFPLLLGWLSDRLSRKPLLIACYLASTLSLIILAASVALWQFWLSTALQTLVGASLAVGAALLADILPAEALGSGLALFGATSAIGLVVGDIALGTAIQNIGMVPSLIASALLVLAGVIMVMLIRRPASRLPKAEITSSVIAGQPN